MPASISKRAAPTEYTAVEFGASGQLRGVIRLLLHLTISDQAAQIQAPGQADGPPVADHYPTTAWHPGEIVQDSRPLLPGDHYLVGLYDPVTADGARLADDAVVLVASQR